MPNLGPVARISLGLVALSMCLLLVANVMFGAAANPAAAARQIRQQLAEHLAVQIAALIEADDERTLGKTLQKVLTRNADVRSVAVRQSEGNLLVERGDHARFWAPSETERSTMDHLRVPLYDDQRHWGDIEISFAPVGPQSLWGWLTQPTSLLLTLVGVGGFAVFYAYLRRAMHLLDPSSAVPERVRKAFDIITDGLLVLDREGQIVLANQAFRELHPESDHDWLGRRPSDLPWLRAALTSFDSDAVPWDRAQREGKAVQNERLTIPSPDGPPTEVTVSCSLIVDGRGGSRGCLVNFDNVSEVIRTNEQLKRTLAALEVSRGEVENKNAELHRLATRDPLTGCLNRRAFFDAAARVLPRSRGGDASFCCIMTDIDHFKRFNDRYGHTTGDQVIRAVAHVLAAQSRADDFLCRYGGEEFCIILPGTAPQQGAAIAERMRASIEADASSAVRAARVGTITASFGVAVTSETNPKIERLIDRADSALYQSKEGGRNRVTVWQPRVAYFPLG